MHDSQNGHLNSTFNEIERLLNMNAVIGEPIHTPSGVTVIPITKLTAGIASGSVDYDSTKKSSHNASGHGGGTGISITPIAFLAVNSSAEVQLIPVNEDNSIARITSAIENAPSIIAKIKDALS